MPLAIPPLPTPTTSSWSLRSWIADLAACPAAEIDLEYSGRWPAETRVRHRCAGRPLASASILHPGVTTDHWTIRAEFVDGRTEVIELPDDLGINY